MMRMKGMAMLLASVVIGVAASTADAGTITFGGNDSDYRQGSGGEFVVTGFTDSALLSPAGHSPRSDALFHTFCVERLNQQYISLTGTYDYVISDHSSAWNSGGTASAVGTGVETTRQLDTHTAYLYTEFYNGTLGSYTATTADDYDYTAGSGRSADAESLQQALWYFQTSTGSYGEQFAYGSMNALAQAYVNMAVNAVNSGAWSGTGNVRILQLTDSNGTTKQDQLTMVPLPPAAFGGLALLGGLGLLRLRRRRRNSSV